MPEVKSLNLKIEMSSLATCNTSFFTLLDLLLISSDNSFGTVVQASMKEGNYTTPVLVPPMARRGSLPFCALLS